MKYEITEEQMDELGAILYRLNRLDVVLRDSWSSKFYRETTTRLYALLQRIEMQDVEDAT
jgi:hypothetical protein